jgi:hypothetical protein
MPDYLYNQGLDLAQHGHFAQAEQYLQAALLFQSYDVEAMLLLAEVQALQGHGETAAATLERAVERGTGGARLGQIQSTLQQILAQESPPAPELVKEPLERAAKEPIPGQPSKPRARQAPAKRRKKAKKKKRAKRGKKRR